MSRHEPSNLAKNLSKSVAKLFVELTEIKAKLQALENDLIFFKELGIEDHINQHNRDLHERELLLDYEGLE